MHIRCPICRREIADAPEDFPHRPFCSRRCKTIDLGNWLTEAYRVSRPLDPDEVDGGGRGEDRGEDQGRGGTYGPN
ncbi:MAG TPA: DNA gyrase inhibitor YacG [Nannocystaceae bacterium]|nr:DNA gyrase inhibitor YacG [Nannocystaceae bacterium]